MIEPTDKIIFSPDVKKVRFDIGMSQSAPNLVAWALTQNNCGLIGVEPNPANFKICAELLSTKMVLLDPGNFEIIVTAGKLPNLSNIRLLSCAFGDVPGPTKAKFFHTHGNYGCSSLYEPKEGGRIHERGWDETEVTVRPWRPILEEVLDSNPQIEFVEYAKLDAQGSDLNILKSAGSLLNKIAMIEVEYTTGNDYVATPMPWQIEDFLEKQNFIVVETGPVDKKFINKDFLNLKEKLLSEPKLDDISCYYIWKNTSEAYKDPDLEYIIMTSYTMTKQIAIDLQLSVHVGNIYDSKMVEMVHDVIPIQKSFNRQLKELMATKVAK